MVLARLLDLGSATETLPHLNRFPEDEQKALLGYQSFHSYLAAKLKKSITAESNTQSKYKAH